jgi:NADP-dependent 3-hydroxy acid dehydrogenase YdfG
MTFVTGASSGIGRSLARRIADSGEAVAVVARRKDLLDSLAAEIERAGGRALALACDVTDRAAVRDAVQRAERRFGPTTTLIANAGGPGDADDVEHFSAQHVADVVDLNLIGVANCIEAVLPGMIERRSGHLVATSSLAAYRGLPASAAYGAAKAAVTNLMESLRIDLRSKGIDVTVVAPGFVRTKPRKKRKKNRPFMLELDVATELIHRAIRKRKPYYAFPKSLLALVWLGWVLPAPLYDRLVAGRGPKTRVEPRRVAHDASSGGREGP